MTDPKPWRTWRGCQSRETRRRLRARTRNDFAWQWRRSQNLKSMLRIARQRFAAAMPGWSWDT